jgi:hypothetical protein
MTQFDTIYEEVMSSVNTQPQQSTVAPKPVAPPKIDPSKLSVLQTKLAKGATTTLTPEDIAMLQSLVGAVPPTQQTAQQPAATQPTQPVQTQPKI